MRNTFVETLIEEAKKDERICLITPDMGYSVLEPFRELFPDRFLNVGIAEQNAVGLAAGMALSGKIVYIYSIIPFVTMRCFEQIRVDLAYMNTNVRLVGVGAGLSYGPAGTTHHAIEDIAIMRALPNMTVCCPGDPIEVREIIKESVVHSGPLYIRLGKSGERTIHKDREIIKIGKANVIVQNKETLIITTSNMLEESKKIVDKLISKGVQVTLVSMHTIKPLDSELILSLLENHSIIYTIEEHNIIGGLGSAIAEVIAESSIGVQFKRIGINDIYTHMVGSQKYLRSNLLDDIEKDF